MSTDLVDKAKLKRIDIDFSQELPPQIDVEITLKIYSTLFKTLRHELWKRVQNEKSKLKVEELPIDDFGRIFEDMQN